MRRLRVRLALAFAAVVVVTVAGVLAFLTLPLADGWRRAAVERSLGHFWGTPVEVRGAVSVQVWPHLQVTARDLSSSSASGEETTVERLDVTLAAGASLFTDGPVRRIGLAGARFALPLRGVSDASPDSLLASPISLLSVLPRLTMERVEVVLADPERGWSFALHVDRLEGAPRDGREVMMAAATFNGHPVTLGIAFDRHPGTDRGDRPYAAEFTFTGPGLQTTLDIRAPTPRFDHGLAMQLKAHTPSIAGLLRLAKVEPVGDGSGSLSMALLAEPHSLSAEAIDLDLTLSDHVRISLTGTVADLIRRRGLDLQAVADIDRDAPPAVSLRDITVTRLSGHITEGRRGLLVNDVLVDTNAFSETLRQIGPISVASVTRDARGRVALRGISIQAGPEDEPVFVITGEVTDILDFSGVTLAGRVDMPVSGVVELPQGGADRLGRIVGQMAVSDADGILGIDSLKARIDGSPVLSAKLDLALDEGAQRDGIREAAVDISLLAPDFGALAGAFGVSTDFSGPAGFAGTLSGVGSDLKAEGRLTVGRTEVDGFLTSRLNGDRTFISGNISSALVYSDEMLAFLRQRQKVDDLRITVVGAALPPGGSRIDVLGTVDFDIKVSAARIDGAGSAASGISARLLLDNGAFRADPVQVTYMGGQINAAVTSQGLPRLRATGGGQGWPVSSFFPRSASVRASGTMRLAFDVTADVQAGKDPLATLGGTLTATVSGGRLTTGMLDLAGLGLLGGLFSPSVWEGSSPLRCVRVPLAFTNGVGRTNPVVVAETDRVRAVGRGTVDLARGRLDLFVSPSPLSGRSLLAGLTGSQSFTIKGPFTSPKIALAAGRAISGNYRCN